MVFDHLGHIDCVFDFLVVVVLRRIVLVVRSPVLVDSFVFDMFLVAVVEFHFDCYNFVFGMCFVVVLERFVLDFDNCSYNFFDFLVDIDFDLERCQFVRQFVQLVAELVDCIDYSLDVHNFGILDFDSFVVVVDKIIVVVAVEMRSVVDNKSNFQLKFCR
jgi:hypothetical protein